jgi:biopolymer transport protein ExbB
VGNLGGTFMELMDQGGWVMWVLLIFSVIALAVIFERWWVLHKARINVNEFLAKIRKALIVNRSIRDAVKICEQYQGPVASVMKAGLLKYGQPKEDVEKTIENAALYELGRLERRPGDSRHHRQRRAAARLLRHRHRHDEVVRRARPAGLSNPGLVAIGIKEALTTTAAGLIVAIPVQIAYNYFMSKVNKFVRDIETSANMLLETFGEMERSGVTPDRRPPAATSPAARRPADEQRTLHGGTMKLQPVSVTPGDPHRDDGGHRVPAHHLLHGHHHLRGRQDPGGAAQDPGPARDPQEGGLRLGDRERADAGQRRRGASSAGTRRGGRPLLRLQRGGRCSRTSRSCSRPTTTSLRAHRLGHRRPQAGEGAGDLPALGAGDRPAPGARRPP